MIQTQAEPDTHSARLHACAGDAFQQQGQLDEAIACYVKALTLHAEYAGAHNNLGTALARQGRLDLAVQAFRAALQLEPGSLDILINLGNALQQQGSLQEAVACYGRALALDARVPEIHNNLGSAYERLGRLDAAADCFQAALALRPGYPEAHFNMANTLRLRQQPDQAAIWYRRAIALRPDDAASYANLGTTYHQQGRLEEAIACYRHAIELCPDLAEPHNNLGNALREQGERESAIACFRTAIAKRPDNAEAHNNLGMALLAQGEWEEGWREFEWRWLTPQMLPARRVFRAPQWNGERAQGRTLLIHAEQGLGDTLQFCRYATLAAERGFRVVLEVQKPLLRLLRSLPGVQYVGTRDETLPEHDLHCPMLSLPRAFGTTLETIPASPGYLSAPPEAAAKWAARLDSALGTRALRVGLVWSGLRRPWTPGTTNIDGRRSTSLATLLPLRVVQGARFISLQKGPAVAEVQTLGGELNLHDMMFDVQDFADTAAVVANLDVVVGVDTSVVHLAGALGKPVFLLDRFDHCWRWLAGRQDSLWYPSMRIFRQSRDGDWGPVIADVAEALAEMVAARSLLS